MAFVHVIYHCVIVTAYYSVIMELYHDVLGESTMTAVLQFIAVNIIAS